MTTESIDQAPGRFVHTDQDDAIATLTIDRPDKRNALSIDLRNEMSDALDRLSGDESVKVVVVRSNGPVFCAGFDLPEFEDSSLQAALWESSDRWHERLRTFPLPLIASVQGPAMAGGFDLATMCDLRVVARSARFARPELTWGPAIYSILHDLVGGALARELTFTNRALSAEEAAELGLVTHLVDDDQLEEATRALAVEVAQAPRSVRMGTKATAITAGTVPVDGVHAW